jgi:cytoskeletal protein RodZ
MAGGLAILLGTLLGINFPMGGQQSAKVPTGGKTSKVLPANINVNSSAAGRNNRSANDNRGSAVQNNSTDDDDFTSDTENTSETNPRESQSLNAQATDTPSNETGSSDNNQPIRALW